MKIQITEKCIKNGIRRDVHCCPIALALQRAGLRDVHVSNRYIQGNGKFKHYAFKLPRKAIAFIWDFDRKKPVKPFAFVLK
jgi:hypothetical protein